MNADFSKSLGNQNLNEAILSAAIRHSSRGWNPGDEPNNLDTGLRRYDVKIIIPKNMLLAGLGPAHSGGALLKKFGQS